MTKLLAILLLVTSIASARVVTTNFPAPAENPISQSGAWQVTNGSNWGTVQTTPGLARGTTQVDPFGDATATLTGNWGSSQTVQGTVSLLSNTTTIAEVELRGRTTLTNTNTTGYELLCNVSTNLANNYGFQFVRWNGTAGQFTIIATNTSVPRCLNGDVIKMVFSGTTVQIFRNGGLLTMVRDNPCGNNPGANQTTLDLTCPAAGGAIYQNGAPGVGFYRAVGGNNSQFANYGWSSFTASDEIPAAGCTVAQINAAIATSSLGDTITVPAGTCAWTGGLTLTGITLQGAGSSTSGTVITGGVATLNKNAAQPTRISGFRFTSTVDTHILAQGSATARAYIIDNSYFFSGGADANNFVTLHANGGLLYANQFTMDPAGDAGGPDVMEIQPGEDWSQAPTFGMNDTQGPSGGERNIYFEDNTFTNCTETCPDADQGTRLVVRHNTYVDSSMVFHSGGGQPPPGGNDTSTFGTRQFEIYNNTFSRVNNTCNANRVNVNKWIWSRGGSGVIANNSFALMSSAGGCFNGISIKLGIGCDVRDTTYPVPFQQGQTIQGPSTQNPPTLPLLIFGNTGAGSGFGASAFSVSGNDSGGGGHTCSNPGNFVQSGRDYKTTNAWASPWVPFTYPHPLASGVVAPTVLTIATTTLPNGTVGTAYSTTLTAVGGTTPYTWTLSTPPLPGGLSLSGAGIISGTPTIAGTFPFTVRVTDAVSATTTQPLSIVITGVNFTISGTVTGVANSGVTVTLTGTSSGTTTTSGTGTYSFTGITSGNYTVTPTKTGYAFTPASTPIVITTGNGTVNFTIKPAAPTNLTLVVN